MVQVVAISQRKYRSGPGPTQVRPQGPVHSPPGPGPIKVGSVHPLSGPDTRTYGVGPVQTQVHEGRDWTSDSLIWYEDEVY